MREHHRCGVAIGRLVTISLICLVLSLPTAMWLPLLTCPYCHFGFRATEGAVLSPEDLRRPCGLCKGSGRVNLWTKWRLDRDLAAVMDRP
jgi:hypothetical protein